MRQFYLKKMIELEIFTLDQDQEVCIPKDTGNRYYQAYLAWVSEGNEAEVIEGN